MSPPQPQRAIRTIFRANLRVSSTLAATLPRPIAETSTFHPETRESPLFPPKSAKPRNFMHFTSSLRQSLLACHVHSYRWVSVFRGPIRVSRPAGGFTELQQNHLSFLVQRRREARKRNDSHRTPAGLRRTIGAIFSSPAGGSHTGDGDRLTQRQQASRSDAVGIWRATKRHLRFHAAFGFRRPCSG